MGLFRDKPYRIADAVIVRDSQLVQLPYHYLKRLEGVAPDVAARLTRNLSEIATTRVRSLAASIAPAAASPPADDPAAPAQTQGAGAAPEAVTLVPIQIKMALARCPMFEGFDQDDLQRLGDRVQATRYPAGQPVFLAGDRADSMYVVALGRLLVVAEVDGDIQEVASLTAGNCFGELALINAEPVRSASILADTLATILRIGYDDLRDATAWRPRTRERFEANLARLAVERS
ncbi:MAG: cyclic nucleotide-binding domain-containing protein [Candidatus Sericytochromatia bacterium]|nr:cyclic nucleotide-binding domain-containing protein [Candidatus Tanganyikabacteria bacterium]